MTRPSPAGAGRRRHHAARRARCPRDHQPARDGLRVGPRDRRAAASRDRLAGPAHRGPLRRAARRATSSSSGAHRPASSTPISRRPRSSGCCDNVDGSAARASGPGRFGTVDTWLICKLTGASRHRRVERFADDAVRHRGGRLGRGAARPVRGPGARAPEVAPAAGSSATTGPRPCTASVPIAGIAGDQQAALFGQACLDPGLGKNTYGTGRSCFMNAGTRPAPDRRRLAVHGRVADRRAALPTRSRRRSSSPAPRCSGSVTGSGSSRWPPTPRRLAASLDGNDGVYFVPALTGLGSPHWDPVRPGHDRRPDPRHAVARTSPVRRSRRSRTRRRRGRSHGGGVRQRADRAAGRRRRRRQRLADAVPGRRARCPVRVPEVAETTALGAAYLAGVGVGLWTIDQVARGWHEKRHLRAADERGRAGAAAARVEPSA